MGVLIQRRPKLESLSNLDPIELYSVANFNNNATPIKVADDIQIALNEIRRRIAIGPPSSIKFIVDNF